MTNSMLSYFTCLLIMLFEEWVIMSLTRAVHRADVARLEKNLQCIQIAELSLMD